MIETTLCYIEKENKYLMLHRVKKEKDINRDKWIGIGGKLEKGETKEEALIRECREELAVTLSVGDVFMDVIHEYPDITVHLTLFNAKIAKGVPEKIEHNDIKWIKVSEIDNFDFCPADEEILDKLKMM